MIILIKLIIMDDAHEPHSVVRIECLATNAPNQFFVTLFHHL